MSNFEQLPGLETQETVTPRHRLTSAHAYLSFQMQLGFAQPPGVRFWGSNHVYSLLLGPLASSLALVELPIAALK